MELMKKNRHAQQGFTLIEILVAIAIIGGILAVVIPFVNTSRRKAKIDTTKIALRNVNNAIESYFNDITAYPETLKDLFRKPANEEAAGKWSGPYVADEKQLVDPFGQKFQYQATPDQEHPYELFSYGPQGKSTPKAERINVWKL